MKNYLSLIAVGIFLSNFVLAAEKPTCPQMDEAMKKCVAAGTPGAAHKMLEPVIGSWNAEVHCWMKPGAPAQVTKGTAKTRWILNGHFIQENFKGEFMGKPFRGIGISGYDNQKKKYNNLWIDDMHTLMFMSEGTANKTGNVITFQGKMDCPVTGQKDMPVKQVLRIVSADKHIFEMYMPGKKGNVKTMEIIYTRK